MEKVNEEKISNKKSQLINTNVYDLWRILSWITQKCYELWNKKQCFDVRHEICKKVKWNELDEEKNFK